MPEELSREWQLQKARERQHIVLAVARAQAEWRDMLPVIEAADDRMAAGAALESAFGLSREQAMAVVDTQLGRLSKTDRQRITDELDDLRREIEGLDRG